MTSDQTSGTTDTPWLGDACSLVDAFRAGERSPAEELEATLRAIADSDLNAFSFVDPERARAAAAKADLSLPFGGVPAGLKELDAYEGWPQTEASLVFKDRIADHTTLYLHRLAQLGGAVPVGLTTASEFGGLNVSVTKLNGVTHNPWQHGRTVGGSSAGSSSAVAGGLVSLATGGDGGGSIRIPAGYTGLLGMKGTFGRIPRSPHAFARPNTVVYGNMSRSVRDAARFYDVCSGADGRDPTSLPKHAGYEAALGSHDLAGRKVAIVPGIGGVALDPGVEDHLRAEAEAMIAANGMIPVDLTIDLPNLAAQWMMGNMATLLAELGDAWPKRADDLTDEIKLGVRLARTMYNLDTAAASEQLRMQANISMAEAFDQVDFIVAATNPGPAFAAEATSSNPQSGAFDSAISSTAGGYALRSALAGVRAAATAVPGLPTKLLGAASERNPELVTMGGLTMISNLHGNPAVSIPAGTVNGLPVGMQVLGKHHHDDLLFDVALAVERERPWPLVAPPVSASVATS